MKKTTFIKVIIGSLISINAYCQSPVDENGALSVNGSHIVNEDGDIVSFAGNSLFWSMAGQNAGSYEGEAYYNADVVNWLADDWSSEVVRCAMGVYESWVPGGMGYLASAADSIAESNKVRTVVDAAIAKGVYVIIDWHSHIADQQEDDAIAFFEMMATEYGDYDNVIYEIFNEPTNQSWSNDIKPYAENVITAIRAIDPDNLILVGTPQWDQQPDIASQDPITGHTNIAYTVHFYAASHGASIRQNAQTAIDNGIALFCSEWGTVLANGGGSPDQTSTDEWMDFFCENSISHCNWSIGDKNEGASALQPMSSTAGNWSSSDLTASGTIVKSIVSGWSARECDPLPGSGSAHISEEKTSSLNIWPNPANDLVTFEQKGKFEVLIYDISGKIVMQTNANDKVSINIIGLESGPYLCEINSENDFKKELLIKK